MGSLVVGTVTGRRLRLLLKLKIRPKPLDIEMYKKGQTGDYHIWVLYSEVSHGQDTMCYYQFTSKSREIWTSMEKARKLGWLKKVKSLFYENI